MDPVEFAVLTRLDQIAEVAAANFSANTYPLIDALRAVVTRPPLDEVGTNDQHAYGYNLALEVVRGEIAHWLGVAG